MICSIAWLMVFEINLDDKTIIFLILYEENCL